MKKIFILILMILTLSIPCIVQAQEIKLGLEYQFKPMTEKQIRAEMLKIDLENVGSLALGAGGIFVSYTGGISFLTGLALSFSEPIIDVNNSDHGFNPLIFAPLLQYATGFMLLIGGPILFLEGLEITHIFSDNIKNNLLIRQNFKMELKRFHPTSYDDHPGIGIGINFPLKNH